MNLILLSGLALASVAGTLVIFLAVSGTRKQRAALREMAVAEGWTFSHEESDGRSGSRTVIADPAEGWAVTLYNRSNASGGGSDTRWSHFDLPALALPDGMAVLGPEIPESSRAMADSLLGRFGGGAMVRMLLDRMTGGLGDELADLRSVAGPGQGALFATPGREDALDRVRDLPELLAARKGRNESQQPIVIRSPQGLRLRYAHLLRRPDEVADFIALGRALAGRLR